MGFANLQGLGYLSLTTVSCIKLDEVLSDIFGKTGQAIIKQIIERGNCNFNPEPYIDKRVKATLEAFQMALDGDVTPATLIKMKMIQDRLEFLGKQKAELESGVASLSKGFSHQLEILHSAPGVDSLSAMSIISEIGVDMKVFGSLKRFLSWVGVVPQNDESAGKKKSTRIGKGNKWLKPVIVQCANAAINSKKHSEIRDKYLALKKRRGHGKALVAIAKRLMTAIYYMLLRDEMYKPYIGKDIVLSLTRIVHGLPVSTAVICQCSMPGSQRAICPNLYFDAKSRIHSVVLRKTAVLLRPLPCSSLIKCERHVNSNKIGETY